jgi:alanine racemase
MDQDHQRINPAQAQAQAKTGQTRPAEKFDSRTAAFIELEKLRSNINNIREAVDGKTKLMAVVKADGYGHGAVETAKTLINNGVDYLGVATLEEGAELRENDIAAPILILGSIARNEMQTALFYDFEMTVFDLKTAEMLSKTCAKTNNRAKIHIKIDTGMGRIGFLPTEQSVEAIALIAAMPEIEIIGIYTHLAESDGADKTFARTQMENFTAFIKKLSERGIDPAIKHISNSGAIIDLPSFHMDMVRAGIILYGLSPSEDVNFKPLELLPALSWKSWLSHVKTIEKGQSLGYGRTFVTERKTVVGTVPVGYADGYARSLSNCGRVLVKGKSAPIIGRVCMDQFMVDLTGIDFPEPGDEVILIGSQGENEITADEMAVMRGTISYEVVCNISKRVKRIYI